MNEDCKECGLCVNFRNGETNDYCELSGEPCECYDSACTDFEE